MNKTLIMSVYARYARYLLPAKQMVQMCKVIEEMKSDEFFKSKRLESDVGKSFPHFSSQGSLVSELKVRRSHNNERSDVQARVDRSEGKVLHKPNLDEHPRRTLRVVGGTITTCTAKEARRFMQDG